LAQRLDLAELAGGFDADRVRSDVDDLRAEHLHCRGHLRPGRGIGFDLVDDVGPPDRGLGFEFDDLDDVDELEPETSVRRAHIIYKVKANSEVSGSSSTILMTLTSLFSC